MFPRLIRKDEPKVNCEDVSFTQMVWYSHVPQAGRRKGGAAVFRVLLALVFLSILELGSYQIGGLALSIVGQISSSGLKV